jgi:hypothetical protein
MLFTVLSSVAATATCPITTTTLTSSIINRPSVNKCTLFASAYGTEIFVGTNEALYRTKDAGTTFSKLTTTNDNYWGAIKTTKGTIITSGLNSLYRSIDNGVTFQALNINVPVPPNEPTYPLRSTAHNMYAQVGNQIYWLTQNFLYISENEGLKWDLIDCKGIQPSRPTLLDCRYLFGRSMLLSPQKNQLLIAMSVPDLSGNLEENGHQNGTY